MSRQNPVLSAHEPPQSVDPRAFVQVMRPRLPSAEQLLPYLRLIDRSGIYSNGGPLTDALRSRLAGHLKLPEQALALAGSGTAALIGAILARAGRAKASRPLCLVPSYTFPATALAAEQCGYDIHLIDIDAAGWLADPIALAAHPMLDKIGLVIPVASFGRPIQQAAWQAFEAHTGIPVVIDGAAAFEAMEADAGLGVLSGAIPVALSFHATKSFSTGEGGAVVTRDTALASRVAQALNFGFGGSRSCETASTNGKMSEYHAAIGLAELDGWAVKKSSAAFVSEAYRRHFAMAGLGDRLAAAPDIAGCYVLFRCGDPGETDLVTAGLRDASIDYRFWYGPGLHRQGHFAVTPRDRLGTTETVAPLLLGLPAGPGLSPDAVVRIVGAVAGAVTHAEPKRMIARPRSFRQGWKQDGETVAIART